MKHFGCIFLFAVLSSAVTAQDLPVSDRAYNNAKDMFRFAIVSDRTGGMRGGIFDGAMDKVEMMQPEFVISVGDLIDGYTEDPDVWNAQWDEFDSIIDGLSMPFYYVPGNHDTSNELLTEVWRERHGKDYYHFLYKDVLFIALNTDEIEGGGIGATQIEYFEKVLEENSDVKWILIFMHRPLWSYEEQLGYDGIEEALGNRKYTLFSGHHHNYRFKLKNGMEHFTLATTGGGSWMRNPDVGELDHITWVTMKASGPKVAHIDVNGIYGKDFVPDEDYEDIQVLRQGNWLEVNPYVSESKSFEKLPITLKVTNNSERAFDISGNFESINGINFEPTHVELTLAKGTMVEIPLEAISETGSSTIAELNNSPIFVELTAGFKREERNDIALSTSKRMFLDWKHILPKTKNGININGDFTDWDGVEWIDVRNPQYFLEDWDWMGEDDGRFEFATQYDSENLYIAVKFYDQLLISEKELSDRQDKFFIHFDPNPDTKEFEAYEIAWAGNGNETMVNSIDIEVKILENAGNQFLEMKIPLHPDEADESDFKFRLNIGIMDHDRPENTKPSILWWRPIWGSEIDYDMSGIFRLEK